MTITYCGRTYRVENELDLRHVIARLNPPPYEIRKALRVATLAVGRA